MAAALGAHVSAVNNGGSSVTTASRTSTGGVGSVFDVAVAWYHVGSQSAPTSISDSKSNVYSLVGTIQDFSTDNLLRHALYRCIAGTGGAGHTWTPNFAGAQDALSVWAAEATGVNTAALQTTANEDGAAPTFTSNSLTVSGGALLTAFVLSNTSISSTETITWGNSFASTGDDITNAANDITGAIGTRVVSAGTYSSSHTSSGAGATGAMIIFVAYPDAAAAATSDLGEGAARRQLRQNANYRMSPRAECEAQQLLRARKRAYGFAAHA